MERRSILSADWRGIPEFLLCFFFFFFSGGNHPLWRHFFTWTSRSHGNFGKSHKGVALVRRARGCNVYTQQPAHWDHVEVLSPVFGSHFWKYLQIPEGGKLAVEILKPGFLESLNMCTGELNVGTHSVTFISRVAHLQA